MRVETVLTVLIVVALAGCGASEPPVAPPASDAPTVEIVTEAGPVEVAAEGTEFEPPIEIVRLPDGVWYCDMGTAHYARGERGDGICPRCGMDLVQKVAEVEPDTSSSEESETTHS